jgi:hypothetical protein
MAVNCANYDRKKKSGILRENPDPTNRDQLHAGWVTPGM